MRYEKVFIIPIFFLSIIFSCEKSENNNPIYEDFCSIIPTGWKAEIIKDNYSPGDTISSKGAVSPPLFVIKYTKPGVEFDYHSATGIIEVNPTLILNFYNIELKQELLNLIRSQAMFSWCTTRYFGETEDYFIVTSPCYINYGHFGSDNTNSKHINDLLAAFYSIITVNEYPIYQY